ARNFHRAHPACLPNHAEACHRRIHWWSEGVRRSPPPYREGMKNMQRRNARSTGVAALAAVALGLTACGGGGGGEDTLRIAALATDRAVVERAVEMFEEANDGVSVDVTYADTDQYQSAIRTQLGSGTAPDVFEVYPGAGNPVTPV